MAGRAKREEVDRWRRNYWRRREHHSNKEMAEKLGIDEGNLSAYGQGTKKNNGKPTNPGEGFIKNFYMQYPELPESQEGNETNPNANKEEPGYNHEDQPSSKAEEAQIRYMNWDDPVVMRNELFTMHKKNDEFLRSELSKATDTSQTAVNTSQTAVAALHEMAKSTFILSQEVVSSLKQTNPGQEKSSPQA
jgi:hypothetical protein